jgi:hypothetical protein
MTVVDRPVPHFEELSHISLLTLKYRKKYRNLINIHVTAG